MKYCVRCGTQADDNAKFCTSCGAPMIEPTYVEPQYRQSCTQPYPTVDLFAKLCSRLRISALLLRISGIVQLILAFGCVGAGIGLIFTAFPLLDDMINVYGVNLYREYVGYYTEDLYYSLAEFGQAGVVVCLIVYFAASLIMVVISILNLIASQRMFRYLKKIQAAPAGIVTHFQPAGKPVVLLVLNIIGGGPLGIIGAAFGLAARCIVTENRAYFETIEQQVR